MLSASPNLPETPELIDFLVPQEDLKLRDYEAEIPNDEYLDYYETIVPITREEWFPVIICGFFSELVQREALDRATVTNFIAALESDPSPITEIEMQLFRECYRRLQKAHSYQVELKPYNITNAIIGYTKSVTAPRDDVIRDWCETFQQEVDERVGMNQKFWERFNAFKLDKILSY